MISSLISKFLRIKNHLAMRFRILKWKMDASSAKAYEKLQIHGSMHTRQEPRNQQDIQAALDFLCTLLPNKSLRILDAGCGDGWTLEQFKAKGYAELAGIDLSEEKLEIARRAGFSQVKKALLPDLDFPDSRFDAVYCRHVFEHLLFPEKTLQSFNRVLVPGGFLFLVVPKTDIGVEVSEAHVLEVKDLKQVEKMVRKAGFEIKEARSVPLDHFEFWIFARKS